jgi:macrolide-specific efflux system membrane fusion protein
VLVKNLADLKRNLNLSLDNARAQFKIQKETNNYYNIISDGSGLVMNVAKKTGDYVKKGDALALLGAGGIIIKLDIAEEDIARIKLGMPALISLNSLKDKIYKARITKIYPSFNNTEQAFIVEAAFEDEPGKILNGTQLQANIIIGQKNNALVIPSFYLFNDDEVMIAAHKQKKRVTIGIRTLEWTEITSGISEKDILTLPKSN